MLDKKRRVNDEKNVEPQNDIEVGATSRRKGRIINILYARVRKDADKDADVLGKILKGTVVEIVGRKNNGFYKICYDDGYGYVQNCFVMEI